MRASKFHQILYKDSIVDILYQNPKSLTTQEAKENLIIAPLDWTKLEVPSK